MQKVTSVAVSSTPTRLKKFWKVATVVMIDESFTIMLDHRSLKSPLGTLVKLPKEKKALAYLVAAEWEAQGPFLKSHSLPLSSILMRAIDFFTVPSNRATVIDKLLAYVHTDSIW